MVRKSPEPDIDEERPPEPAADRPAEPIRPPLRVHGHQADRISVISIAAISMVVGIGYVEELATLVPYIELTLQEEGEDDPNATLGFEPTRTYSKSITHDNAAFILGQLADDLLDACRQLRALSSGDLKPEPTQVRRSRDYLAEAQGDLRECVKELDSLLSSMEPVN